MGGVSCIINLLSSNEENIRVLAAWALSNVSADEAQTISTCRDVGIPLLINMMEYSTSGIQQAKAASCVANLCMLDANKDLILKLRGILPVVHCLSAKEPKIKAEAARTVSLLAQHGLNSLTHQNLTLCSAYEKCFYRHQSDSTSYCIVARKETRSSRTRLVSFYTINISLFHLVGLLQF